MTTSAAVGAAAPKEEPAASFVWWTGSRLDSTVAGRAQMDVQRHWQQVGQAGGAAGGQSAARERAREQARATHIDLHQEGQPGLVGATSSYKSDMCAGHKRVGRRRVVLPEPALQSVSVLAHCRMHWCWCESFPAV